MCVGIGARSKQITVTTSHLNPYLRSPLRVTGKTPWCAHPKALGTDGQGNAHPQCSPGDSMTTRLLPTTDLGALIYVHHLREHHTSPVGPVSPDPSLKDGESETQRGEDHASVKTFGESHTRFCLTSKHVPSTAPVCWHQRPWAPVTPSVLS